MIIAVCNQKGGVGKTATAQAIAAGAKKRGYKSLAIDLDPQANLSYSMGGNLGDMGIYEVLTEETTANIAIQHLKQADLIATNNKLVSFSGKESIEALKNALRPIKNKYDVVTIDCPPTLNILLFNALCVADLVIIPSTTDIFALQGLSQLKNTIDQAKQINKKLKIGGVLFVKHNNRTVLAKDLKEVIQEQCDGMKIPIYNTSIREGVAIREAQTYRESIFDYAPKSKPAIDYNNFLDEIIL